MIGTCWRKSGVLEPIQDTGQVERREQTLSLHHVGERLFTIEYQK